MKINIHEYRQGLYKSEGGLIRAFLKEDEGCIKEIIFTGDFFIFPEGSLDLMAQSLKNAVLERDRIRNIIGELFRREGVDSPGTTAEDFAEAVMAAAR